MKDAEYTGYYERVKDGEGTFVQKIVKGEDGNESLSFVRQDHGNIIWHTVNDFEKSDYKDQTFDEKTDRELTNEGDRIYTKRKSTGDKSKDNINVTENYYLYKNNDYFLKDSIGCKTQEEADNYSVIIKTITPEELNARPEWADYADLYVISPKVHSGGDNIREIWKNTTGTESIRLFLRIRMDLMDRKISAGMLSRKCIRRSIRRRTMPRFLWIPGCI